MLNGNVMGLLIANAVTDPTASPAARATVIAQWVNISSVIITYLQTNAMIISNPLIIGAPAPVPGMNMPPAPDGVAVLAGATGPVGGVISVSPISSRLL